jgi:hypothetical protein
MENCLLFLYLFAKTCRLSNLFAKRSFHFTFLPFLSNAYINVC